MSNFGGGGRGGGRGRSSSGRGGGRGNYRGGGGGQNRGRGDGGGGSVFSTAKLRPCSNYTTTGNCAKGANCNFSHAVQLHAKVDASSMVSNNSQGGGNYRGGYNNSNSQQRPAAVSSISIWETNGEIKIFTGSHDGFWRLWNTTGGNFSKQADFPMAGKVECISVVGSFLFCGFEGVSKVLPDVPVGMVHSWNLQQTSAQPLELHISASAGGAAGGPGMQFLPYAHNQAVTALCIAVDDTGAKVVSGSRDGSIRVWAYQDNKFVLAKSLPGHAREVTGLVLLPANNLLWSCSTDGSIRIWDLKGPGPTADCQYCITRDTPANPAAPVTPQQQQQPGVGHTSAVTALLSFNSPAGVFILSSSLDGTIKAWNGTTGECVMSENNGEGVVSMSLAKDSQGNELLLIGLESGSIMCRNLVQTPKTPAFQLLFVLTSKFTAGHNGAVKTISPGPAATFYTGGDDGKMLVWQITGDLGIK